MEGRRLSRGPGRLWRLWRLYARMDLIWMARGGASFLLYLWSDLVLGVSAVTLVFLIAERFDGIGRWSKNEVLFMLGYGVLVRGMVDMLFNYNIAAVSRRIGRGQLDHLLVQPQPLWLALLTEGFAPFSGSSTALIGVGLLAWAGWKLALRPHPAWLALLALNLTASVAVYTAWSYVWGSAAFWAPRAAEEINSSSRRMVDELRQFPLDGVGPVLLGGLLSVFPVGFAAWYPSRALLGLDANPAGPVITPLAAALMGALAAYVFRRGLEQYGRTGSQRYLLRGHRR